MTTPAEVLTTVEVAAPFITIGARPKDPFYRYRWGDRDLPSWSSIRATAGLKPQIHAWALEGMARKAIEISPSLSAAVLSNNEPVIAWARERLWDAAADEQGRAARFGTAVHEAVAASTPPDKLDEPVAVHVQWFADWLRTSGAQVIANEFVIYNLALGYGGTGDLLVLMPDGSVWVVDLKTGKSLWGEYLLQVMGYANGEFVARDGVVDDRLTGVLQSVRGIGILHLSEKGWEFRGLRSDAAAWAAFRGLLTFAVWQHDHDDIDSVTASVTRNRR